MEERRRSTLIPRAIFRYTLLCNSHGSEGCDHTIDGDLNTVNCAPIAPGGGGGSANARGGYRKRGGDVFFC